MLNVNSRIMPKIIHEGRKHIKAIKKATKYASGIIKKVKINLLWFISSITKFIPSINRGEIKPVKNAARIPRHPPFIILAIVLLNIRTPLLI